MSHHDPNEEMDGGEDGVDTGVRRLILFELPRTTSRQDIGSLVELGRGLTDAAAVDAAWATSSHSVSNRPTVFVMFDVLSSLGGPVEEASAYIRLFELADRLGGTFLSAAYTRQFDDTDEPRSGERWTRYVLLCQFDLDVDPELIDRAQEKLTAVGDLPEIIRHELGRASDYSRVTLYCVIDVPDRPSLARVQISPQWQGFLDYVGLISHIMSVKFDYPPTS
jgi:hypothetical protein